VKIGIRDLERGRRRKEERGNGSVLEKKRVLRESDGEKESEVAIAFVFLFFSLLLSVDSFCLLMQIYLSQYSFILLFTSKIENPDYVILESSIIFHKVRIILIKPKDSRQKKNIFFFQKNIIFTILYYN